MQKGHCLESGGCVQNWDSSKETVRHIMRGADVWRGRLSWIPFKVLLYDDMIGVVTSRHVTKMAITLFDPTWTKPPVIRKLLGSISYTSEVIAD